MSGMVIDRNSTYMLRGHKVNSSQKRAPKVIGMKSSLRRRSFVQFRARSQSGKYVRRSLVYSHRRRSVGGHWDMSMGGAPIGAGGDDPTFRGKGDRETQFGDNLHLTFCSYHAFTLMSTQYFISHWPKSGVKKFLLASLTEFVQHFQNGSAAPGYVPYFLKWRVRPVFCPSLLLAGRHICTNAHGIRWMIGAIFVEFSRLILMKISKIVATRCQILRLKYTKFNFGWGSAPDHTGKLTALPRP